MMRRLARLGLDDGGAVAPTVALSLIGLIAVGGIAFDYAHMASMDTELQQAADQAALAAATQLDGTAGACSRASAAAASLLSNETRFANDGLGRAVAVTAETACDGTGNIRFYKSYNEVTDVPGDPATTDKDAKVVVVYVTARAANYALTPIVGVMTSGNVGASAVASLSSAVCKVPPLMICGPSSNFPQSTDVGKGVLLEPGSSDFWVPGNYGYLDFGNGASGVKANLGRNNDVATCTDDDTGISTEPGNQASVTQALNSRFDLYPASSTACNAATGNFCPAENVTKDLAYTEEVDVRVKVTDPVPANPGCGAAGAKKVDTDNNVDTSGMSSSVYPRGYPRDTCQLPGGTCTASKFGDGEWDRTSFVSDRHPGTTVSAIATARGKSSTTLTRWDVYQWELADKTARLGPYSKNITATPIPSKTTGQNITYTFRNRCGSPQPINGTAVSASASQKDRRLLTVAVVDCSGEKGKFNAKVLRFADMFLVEPSLDRTVAKGSAYATGKEQIYAEVVRVAERPNGQSSFQYYLRQRPRLLK